MIKELINLSKYAGMREDLVQAGGGNTSIKISDTEMLIKASGYQLADITEEKGYALVNYKIIENFFNDRNLDTIVKADEKKILSQAFICGEKPSIETFLHSITGRVTLHTHPVLVNILTARYGGMKMLKQLFPNSIVVEYATPGIELAVEYFDALKKHNEKANIIFLKNHGLIVSGESLDEVCELTDNIISAIATKLKIDNTDYSNCTMLNDGLVKVGVEGKVVCLMKDYDIYMTYEKKGRKTWEHTFCPDALVYCGKKVMDLCDNFTEKDIEYFISLYGMPAVILYNNKFYAVATSVKKAKEIESLFAFTARVVLYNEVSEIELLSDREQNFLLNWDAEKYRQNMK